ncbi:hypothetical protein ACVXZ0_11930 [Staphylococcus aureus]
MSFLAGKDSDYITGQTIIVDGGIRIHNNHALAINKSLLLSLIT